MDTEYRIQSFFCEGVGLLNIKFTSSSPKCMEEYIRMKMKGLTDDDFMKTNRLDRERMASFLDMVREEGNKVLKEQWQDCMVEIPNITARL